MFLLAALGLLCVLSPVQSKKHVVYWTDTETKVYTAGHHNLELFCATEETFDTLLFEQVDIYYKQTRNSEETHLFSNGHRVDASPDFYRMDMQPSDHGFQFKLKILTLRPKDDGFFVCRIGADESSVEVVVLEQLEEVSLTVDDQPPITHDQDNPIVLEPGQHSFTCATAKTNPRPTDVSIFVNGSKIESLGMVYHFFYPEGDNRKTVAYVEAKITIEQQRHDGTTVKCVGVGPANNSRSVSLPIRVKKTSPDDSGAAGSSRADVFGSVLKGANPLVIPKPNNSMPVTVQVEFSLTNIANVDQANGEVDFTLFTAYSWKDPTLKWDASRWGGIRQIHVPTDRIWTPDTMFYGITRPSQILSPQLAQVNSDGSVLTVPSERVTAVCNTTGIDTDYGARCTLLFGSWTYASNDLDLTLKLSEDGQINMADYGAYSKYDVLSAKAERDVVVHACCPEPYTRLTLILQFKKRQ